MTWSSPKCLRLPTIHTRILWKNPVSPLLQAAVVFLWKWLGWERDGPGLRNGSFGRISFLEKPSSDRAQKGQNPRCWTGALGSDPNSAPDQPGSQRHGWPGSVDPMPSALSQVSDTRAEFLLLCRQTGIHDTDCISFLGSKILEPQGRQVGWEHLPGGTQENPIGHRNRYPPPPPRKGLMAPS